MSKRVLVCGGRDYKDKETLTRVLNALHNKHPIDTIIHGAATGADMLADDWARMKKIRVQYFKPNWGKYGNAAGPIRNQQMLDEGKPDLVVAFPGGTGTADMCRKAHKAGLVVLKIRNKPFDPDISI